MSDAVFTASAEVGSIRSTLNIYVDTNIANPRDDEEVTAIWAYGTHRRYNFHESNADTVYQQILKLTPKIPLGVLAQDVWTILTWLYKYQDSKTPYRIEPVYMYDHSGLSFSTSSFSDSWDSGQIGWIMVTKETYTEHVCAEWDIPSAVKLLKAAITEMDDVRTYGGYWFEFIQEEACCTCGNFKELSNDACSGFCGPVSRQVVESDGSITLSGAKYAIKEHLPLDYAYLIDTWG